MMIGELFNTLLFQPLYNLLIAMTVAIPGHYLWVSIVILTLLVKIILTPLSKKAIRSQIELKAIEGEVKKIKETYSDQHERAQKTMELYKEKNINPFSGCLMLIVQLPIIFALYFVFYKGIGTGGVVNEDLLYESVRNLISGSVNIKLSFFWIDRITDKSMVLAILTALTQFFQMRISLQTSPQTQEQQIGQNSKATGTDVMKEEFAKNMQFQMRYILPVIIGFVAYSISAAVALYWTVSNIYSIVQEVTIRRPLMEKHERVS